MLTKLHINIVTYVTSTGFTKLSENTELILSLAKVTQKCPGVMINIAVNKSSFEAINHLIGLLRSYGVTNHEVYSHEPNNLGDARNALLNRASNRCINAFVTQVDDDDYIRPEVLISIINDWKFDLARDRFNFFLFYWNRSFECREYPKDIKDKPLSCIGKSTFTFSDWGWITWLPYLKRHGLDYMEGSHLLDDNLFHFKSCLMNKVADFYAVSFYVWNQINPGMSKDHDDKSNYLVKLTDYLKRSDPARIGYDMTPYMIVNNQRVPLDTNVWYYQDQQVREVFLTGGVTAVTLSMHNGIHFYKDNPVREIMTVSEYVRLYSAYQFVGIYRDLAELLGVNIDNPSESKEYLLTINYIYLGKLCY